MLNRGTKDNTSHERNNNSNNNNKLFVSQNEISSQFVSFNNIKGLQQQNLKIITTTLDLTKMFENYSSKNLNDENEKDKLTDKISNLHNKIEVLITENDSFKLLVNDDKLIAQQYEIALRLTI